MTATEQALVKVAETLEAQAQALRLLAAVPKDLQTLTVAECARRLGVSTTAIYDEVAKGRLKSIRVGARYSVPVEEFSRYVDRRTR